MNCLVILLAVTIMMVGNPAASAAAAGDSILKPDEFAIMAWGTSPTNLDALIDMRECGINLSGFARPENLDLVSEAGLQCFVSDTSVRVDDVAAQLDQAEIDKRVQALVGRVGDHKAVYGYYLRDEPSAGAFPGLGRWAAAFKKAAPNALPYINLLPNYASPEQLGTATYDEHIESYVEQVRPEFLSYDHYALMDDGSLRVSYFQNLESMRNASLRHNLPFWNIVLSNAHFNYADPTPGGLRFQAYTTLAYGARGISYFTYVGSHTGNYRLSPIDAFGHKTPTYDMLREVNLQIHRLAPVYLTLKSVNVFHYPEAPSGCLGIETSKLLASVDGLNLVVGEFEGPKGEPYVMVVNKDLHESAMFDVRFKREGRVQKVSQYTGKPQTLRDGDHWLAPGQGILLCLERPAK